MQGRIDSEHLRPTALMGQQQLTSLRERSRATLTALAIIGLSIGVLILITLSKQNQQAKLDQSFYATLLHLSDFKAQLVSLDAMSIASSNDANAQHSAFLALKNTSAKIIRDLYILRPLIEDKCARQAALCEQNIDLDGRVHQMKVISDRLSLIDATPMELMAGFNDIWTTGDTILLSRVQDETQRMMQLFSLQNALSINTTRIWYALGLLTQLSLFFLSWLIIIRPNFHLVARNTTQLLEHQRELHFRATHHPLTHLRNREEFRRLGTQWLEQNQGTAIFIIDVDRFKSINDTYGHLMGDLVLKQISKSLQQLEHQHLKVFHLSGDEFALVGRQHAAEESQVKQTCRAIIKYCTQQVKRAELAVRPTVSVGAAMTSASSVELDWMIANADHALYRCKHASGNQFCVVNDYEAPSNARFNQLPFELDTALRMQQFSVKYQPIFDLRTHEMVYCEALSRWEHPMFGVIAPDTWIPMISSRGLAFEFFEYCVAQICEDWCTSTAPKPERISINIHPTVLQSENLIPCIQNALKRLAPMNLVLEITEDAYLDQRSDVVHQSLRKLRQIGVKIALDDFGTGFGSLMHLIQLPLDIVKIDGEFVKSVTESRASQAIVDAQIRCCQGLDLTVVAEKIENLAQQQALLSMGCHLGQGFIYAPALSIKQLEHRSDDQHPGSRLQPSP
ncbi:MAG: GGDEF and EAL domain-containing protein [Gammaproteobacteria bacterium]|nr:GGDEF and EAL domain-containing protein [Gammaproteobacteria bacterium]